MFYDVLIIFFKQVKFLYFLFDVVDFDVVSFVDFNCFCFMDINVQVSLFGCYFQVGSFKLRGLKIIRKSVDVIRKVMQDFKFQMLVFIVCQWGFCRLFCQFIIRLNVIGNDFVIVFLRRI